jgi:hypothetical protein
MKNENEIQISNLNRTNTELQNQFIQLKEENQNLKEQLDMIKFQQKVSIYQPMNCTSNHQMREEKEKLIQHQINLMKFDCQLAISSLKQNTEELQNNRTKLKNIRCYFRK